jgi:putative ABC transport system substrate-binding protein
VVIGFLGLGSPAVAGRRVDALRLGLKDLDLVEGQDYRIELRTIEGDYSRLGEASAELIRLGPAVLVTQGTPGTAALKKATSTIPIVTVSGDAIAMGLIASLNRPGGNVTGLTFFGPELMAKRLELLKEALPQAEGAGVLLNATNALSPSLLEALDATSRAMKLHVHPVLVNGEGDLDRAFSTFGEKKVDGVIVHEEPMLIANASRIAALAAERRLLTVGFVELVEKGGTIAYGTDFSDLYRRSAQYVARILRGAEPRNMPVERPTKFTLVVNARAAKAMRIVLPLALVARADEVIE